MTLLLEPDAPPARRDVADGSPPPLHHGALYALALGTFAVGTEGFMIAALLPTISASLSVTIQAAGQLVTVFALVYALSSPILTALTAALPRRQLLMLSLAAFAAANFVAAVASGYWALAGARVLLALSAGLYVPNANALAGAMAAPHHRGRALGIVNGGITVAIAIGVPLGAFVGSRYGWRATFVGVGLLSTMALMVLGLMLPRNAAVMAPAGLRDRLAVIAAPGASLTLATTTLWALAAYAVYTYIAPYLSVAGGFAPGQVGLVLFLYGGAALVGVTLGGWALDRFGNRTVQAVALPAMALAFAGLTTVALLRGPAIAGIIIGLVVIWGISAWAFFPAQQDRLIGVAGLANTPVILSLNASFMYLGFAAGAVLGSLVITFLGIAWIGSAGAVALVAAMAMSRFARRRAPAPPALASSR
ncbi:MFS transporter [Sphingomonas sp. AR_OL41]|uniref:MFS transporter n=1 Tax=Sphingomonas sp. AR_OL41 TaxID=3042729 RepID=UPI002481727C|nr:MFS transporter [Sphingomonas sp. AR_OL41]MDH7973882.1 MFS transporter [Sphingomonas sp. AR_OL41]